MPSVDSPPPAITPFPSSRRKTGGFARHTECISLTPIHFRMTSDKNVSPSSEDDEAVFTCVFGTMRGERPNRTSVRPDRALCRTILCNRLHDMRLSSAFPGSHSNSTISPPPSLRFSSPNSRSRERPCPLLCAFREAGADRNPSDLSAVPFLPFPFVVH